MVGIRGKLRLFLLEIELKRADTLERYTLSIKKDMWRSDLKCMIDMVKK